MDIAAALDWSRIDTVLLDLDGTLLDLRFDNWFWLDLIPGHYAKAQGISVMAATAMLEPKFAARRGTLEWYCIDHWSRELNLDIATLKRASLERVGYLPGAEAFLRRLGQSGKRRVLVTNSHPVTLAIKDERVGVTAHFDACYSSHSFNVPKENPAFWPLLLARESFVAKRTLFVDDSLPVLHAAQGFGIRWLCAIRRPDSGKSEQITGAYPAVNGVADLL